MKLLILFVSIVAVHAVVRQSAWLYHWVALDPHTVSEALQYFDCSDVFLSIDGRKIDPSQEVYNATLTTKLSSLIDILVHDSINPHFLMLEDYNFGLTSGYDYRPHIDGVVKYLTTHPANISSLHFDVEPHQNPAWITGDKSDLFNQWKTQMLAVSQYVGTTTLAGIDLCLDVPRWFMGESYAPGYPQYLGDAGYSIDMMVYGDIGSVPADFDGCKDELAVIKSWIGIGYDEFTTLESLLTLRSSISASFSTDFPTNFIGCSIFTGDELVQYYERDQRCRKEGDLNAQGRYAPLTLKSCECTANFHEVDAVCIANPRFISFPTPAADSQHIVNTALQMEWTFAGAIPLVNLTIDGLKIATDIENTGSHTWMITENLLGGQSSVQVYVQVSSNNLSLDSNTFSVTSGATHSDLSIFLFAFVALFLV